jgi:uncharacterized repeat protein (TIGR01451 family)
VVITGTNFTGATSVEFGGYKASKFTVDSATQITAEVSDKGNTGDVTITTPAGIGSKEGFKYLKLEMETKVAELSGESTATFSADVDINYQWPDKRRVSLVVTPPKNWASTVTYSGTQVASINMGPSESFSSSERVTVTFSPIYWFDTNPGSYTTKLDVTAGDLKTSLDLVAKVTAKYRLTISTENGRYNTEATAGRDSRFTIQIVNDGTANLENVVFSSTNPTGWSVKFDPDKVEAITPGDKKNVDVIINAPKGKTIAGDYMITVNSNAKEGQDSKDVRVTVLTPSVMGVVGVIIVIIVIVGLVVLFWRLGRR